MCDHHKLTVEMSAEERNSDETTARIQRELEDIATDQHEAEPCSRPGCGQEASYFLCSCYPVKRGVHDDTYLCADCCAALFAEVTGEDEDDFGWEAITMPDGVAYEFGGYSCDENCRICNE